MAFHLIRFLLVWYAPPEAPEGLSAAEIVLLGTIALLLALNLILILTSARRR